MRLPSIVLCLAFVAVTAVQSHAQRSRDTSIFDRDNLFAWCIVPFDAKKRGPEARAEMLARMGIAKLAYDWRAEHIPTFDEEIETLRRWGITLQAFWFPAAINDEANAILDVLRRHDVKTELWVSMHGGEIECTPEEHAKRVADHVTALRPIVDAASALGCNVGLYNHGGWFGEPENQLEILEALDAPNVGLVYNLHHGHGHLDRFAQLLEKMKPHLYCLNLNGMIRGGDEAGHKIVPLGNGDLDLELLRTIAQSGYDGPIGILGHTMDDAEETLLDNLDGLEWLVAQLKGESPGPRPPLRVGGAVRSSETSEDPARRAALPPYQVIPAADAASLTAAQEPPEEYYTTWNRSHGDNHNSRYSAATQIDRSNVADLEIAWIYHSRDTPGNVQCNPIVVDGVMYAPTSGQSIVAVDATTGEERWRFDPNEKPAFRGLTYWPGNGAHSPRLYVPAADSLYALDPASGKPIPGFGSRGRIAIGESRVAPAIYRDTIIVPLYLKDVAAFDVVTGEPRWTFHTIPEDGEYGRDSWSAPEEGANCWGGMALDEARGIAYVSTGSPKPNFAGNNHLGQNLFSNCVIALNADTGERLWHFQELRHDIWDLDIPAPPNLLSLDWKGRRVDVVAQTTKMGNTLLLDRVTGAPLFPFVLRRAPVSPLPGERTWPYQPDARLPEPFARQQFTIHDVTNRTPAARAEVLARLQNARYGWFETFEENVPTALYGFHGGAEWTGAAVDPKRGRLYVSANNVPWIVTVFEPDPIVRDPNAPPTQGESIYREHCMECHGSDRFGVGMYPPLQGLGRRHDDASVRALLKSGRSLMPAIADTVTEDEIQALLDYLFLRDIPDDVRRVRSGPKRYTHNGYPKLLDDEGYPGCKPPWGTLNCLELSTGKILCQVPLGVYPELAEWGIDDTGAENFGGPTVTAGGLVFCAGTPDLKIRAFNADTGEILWEHALPYGGYAPPTVYEADGKQYVLIPATGGGKLDTETGDTYVAFALNRA